MWRHFAMCSFSSKVYFVSAKLHAAQIIPLDPHLYVVRDPGRMPPVNWGREDAKGISFLGGLQNSMCKVYWGRCSHPSRCIYVERWRSVKTHVTLQSLSPGWKLVILKLQHLPGPSLLRSLRCHSCLCMFCCAEGKSRGLAGMKLSDSCRLSGSAKTQQGVRF